MSVIAKRMRCFECALFICAEGELKSDLDSLVEGVEAVLARAVTPQVKG